MKKETFMILFIILGNLEITGALAEEWEEWNCEKKSTHPIEEKTILVIVVSILVSYACLVSFTMIYIQYHRKTFGVGKTSGSNHGETAVKREALSDKGFTYPTWTTQEREFAAKLHTVLSEELDRVLLGVSSK